MSMSTPNKKKSHCNAERNAVKKWILTLILARNCVDVSMKFFVVLPKAMIICHNDE